jgi:hypothetical protein
MNELEERFYYLCNIWKMETEGMSFGKQDHYAYQEIIEMGPSVIPLILDDIEYGHWFYALHKLTGKDPVPKEHKGNTQMMIFYWKEELGAR